MPQVPDRIDPTQRVRMGPGPSDVPAGVLEAMVAPTLGHLDPQYLGIMDQTRQMLRDLFRTSNEATMVKRWLPRVRLMKRRPAPVLEVRDA